MAHGRFNGISAPPFLSPGQKIEITATAVNDGDAKGYFRICVMKVAPLLGDYYPEYGGLIREWAIHCSRTSTLLAGETYTFESNKLLMQTLPNATLWIVLVVQQQDIIVGAGEDDILNMSIDEITEVTIVNRLWTG
jgi:hypothetical protein